MSIQIIDNFNLSVAKPIDDRFVVGSQSLYPNVSYNNKNDIPYKYAGLRVWDLDLGVPFVWSGTSWTSENSISISGSGSASYVPKFVGPPNSSTLGNSNIYISGNSVGINNTSITAGYILDIIGGVRSQGATGFSGVGTLLTNLNATNISTGTMSLARLANNNTSGWILTSGASQPLYVNPSTVTVGAASASVVFNETGNSNVHYVGFFSNSTGSLQSKVSKFSTSTNTLSRQLTYQPSSGILASAIIQAGTISVTGNITTGTITSTGNIIASSALTVNGTSTLNSNLIISGANRAFIGTVNTTTGGKLVVGGGVEVQDGGLYSNLYYGGSPSDWRRSTTSPGFGLFYQTYAAQNKYIFYVNSSGSVGSITSIKEVYKVDPSSSTPQLEVMNGLKPKLSMAYTANYQSSTTLNHNLGYIPIVVVSSNGGNLNPFISGLTTTQVTIWNYPPSGGNNSTGTVYFW